MTLKAADREWMVALALAAGFDIAGVAAVPDEASEEAAAADERFAAWVAAGHAGEMEYLKRADEQGQMVRGDLRRAIPWARSVVVCAVNYSSDEALSIEPAAEDAGWIARYAWSGREDSASLYEGSDYHDVLLERLQVVEAELKQHYGCETRSYVDTGPILERGYAARAGIGWIGKNTCVIHQEQGSWLLLGVIVTSLEVAEGAASVAAMDRCGSCTRCIDACPTQALLVPGEDGVRQMDASRCIAYLTIEKKGSLPEELREGMGRQVFGCDICQDVCPWNAKARRGAVVGSKLLPVREELVNPALEWLAGLDGVAFNRLFRGSPVERTRRKRLLRNVAIAMGNSGLEKFLPQLEAWAAGEDAVLAEAAAWAVGRVRAK